MLVRTPSSRALRVLRFRGRVRVHAVPGGWAWSCPGERHPGVRAGESLGEVVPSWAYRDAWAVAYALGVRHHQLMHADGARLGLDLAFELVDAEPDGPVHPPDPDAVHHLEVCS